MQKTILNIGILAHVDAGKTTLYCQRLDKEIKVNQLLQNRTGRLEVIKALPCNDIGIIAVSHGIIAGDTLGRNMKIPPPGTHCPERSLGCGGSL